MDQDKGWKVLFSDDERFADLVNGYACGGAQVLRGSDLQELDTQTGFFQGARMRLM